MTEEAVACLHQLHSCRGTAEMSLWLQLDPSVSKSKAVNCLTQLQSCHGAADVSRCQQVHQSTIATYLYFQELQTSYWL